MNPPRERPSPSPPPPPSPGGRRGSATASRPGVPRAQPPFEARAGGGSVRAPAACWWARTIVESTETSQSMSPAASASAWTSWSRRSHVPSARVRRPEPAARGVPGHPHTAEAVGDGPPALGEAGEPPQPLTRRGPVHGKQRRRPGRPRRGDDRDGHLRRHPRPAGRGVCQRRADVLGVAADQLREHDQARLRRQPAGVIRSFGGTAAAARASDVTSAVAKYSSASRRIASSYRSRTCAPIAPGEAPAPGSVGSTLARPALIATAIVSTAVDYQQAETIRERQSGSSAGSGGDQAGPDKSVVMPAHDIDPDPAPPREQARRPAFVTPKGLSHARDLGRHPLFPLMGRPCYKAPSRITKPG